MYHMWSPVQPQGAPQGQGADLQGQVFLRAVCYGYLMVATDGAGELKRGDLLGCSQVWHTGYIPYTLQMDYFEFTLKHNKPDFNL